MMPQTLAEILSLAAAYERELSAPPPPLTPPHGAEVARWIDHTLLKPEATAGQIKKLCTEAGEHGFATVCVNPVYVSLAKGLLKGTDVGVCAVVAFPLGATLPDLKAHETRAVIEQGADEVDMVINLGALRGEAYALVLNDILSVTQEAHSLNVKVKVIIEAALLTRREKILACLLSKAAGADCVKTSTGFGPGGATVEDVSLMRCVVGSETGVKAAGGIRTLKDALAMIAAGANRLGASAGVSILQEALLQGANP
jgi:deoxyribose-phosphate aldolase